LNKLKQAEAMENALVNRKIDSTERFENIINNLVTQANSGSDTNNSNSYNRYSTAS